MDIKYLRLLAKEYPTIESAASEIINLSAIRSLPKGTEYFFSDMHGEWEAFLHMLRSASGMIKIKIDLVLGKTVSARDREQLAELIYYPEKEISRLTNSGEMSDEWKRLSIYRLILVCEAVSAKYITLQVRERQRIFMPVKNRSYISGDLTKTATTIKIVVDGTSRQRGGNVVRGSQRELHIFHKDTCTVIGIARHRKELVAELGGNTTVG